MLVLGSAATVFIFVFARANVQDSDRSLVRERTGQTLSVVLTVTQQVEAIVAAGAIAAEFTNGDPSAFQAATGGVTTSLLSSLSLVRIEPGGPTLVTSVGRRAPLLFDELGAGDLATLDEIAGTGSRLTYVARGTVAGEHLAAFATSAGPGSTLVLYSEITAADAQAQTQASGIASSDMRFAIYLGDAATPDALILSSPDGLPSGGNVVTDRVPIGGEELIVVLGPRHRLVSGFAWAAPWILLAIGLVQTVLIAILVERGRRRRDEALRLVDDLERRTQELDRALAEQRRAEEEARVSAERLRHAQRMEAIGQLAGGVAHDFNNLLTAIIGSTRLLLRGTQPGDPVRSGLEDVERAADRAASLTRQLLAFSRKQVLQPSVVDLNRIVRETETLLRHLIRADIRLVTELDLELAPVEADESQVEQVLVNLVVNGADAIRDGGTVTITTANDEVCNCPGASLPPGRCVVLSVSDDGIGMDEETRERVFEPFFTTKELGRGTGLGLATVYGVVEQSGGMIEVESEPDAGTTFRIYLPAVDKEVAAPPTGGARPESTAGTETVLVAEDDEMVRTLVRITLEDSGYTVLEAASGETALELCEHGPEQIHVLVTDMVMPGMGGRALADRLQTLRPELRVLFVSGYAEAEVAGSGGAEDGTSFLEKPFTPEELAHEVRALIDRPRVRA